ncbi:type III polyketide synthase [Microbacterium sp. STN6]|uniref:type III polyketide synthase n=1 Tax=Microbacterium sp. STN6 TaxID=2995588 RepID=UPI002260D245|nr:type III polyketide synthase [Microbacterium sp. STN6]MCX7522691.1 type III polyketide synthase [Microbacterium sp. STN6]
MSRIVAVAPALPPHVYRQEQITETLATLITDDPSRQALMRRMHAASRVDTRHLVAPLDYYRDLGSFDQTNDLFISAGTDLAERALSDALAAAALDAAEVDFFLFTTVTGVSAPSIDAELVRRVGMRSDVKRLPSFGLGCVAGAAGLARVHDYLEGHPGEVGVLVALELCSLTVQRDDDSMANIVASGLFGDGAAAAVLVGDDRAARLGLAGPDIVDTRSRLYPDSEGVLGWDIGGTGFRIVLGAGVPAVIDHNFRADALGLLSEHGLTVADVGQWIAHPGGPKVLEAFARALEVPDSALASGWAVLKRAGNLSSAAVLHSLADVMAEVSTTHPQTDAAPAGAVIGLLFALGPGVSAELVLLKWRAA